MVRAAKMAGSPPPPPPLQAALPSHIWTRTLVWLNWHAYVKKQRDPSHVNPKLVV